MKNKLLRFFLLIFLSFNTFSFSQWTRVEQVPPDEVGSLHFDGTNFYAGSVNRLYTSSDMGITWKQMPVINDSLDFISVITKVDSRLFIGTYYFGIYESTDEGNSWVERNDGLSEPGAKVIMDLELREDKLYAATDGAGVFVYHLNGSNTWVPFRNGLFSGTSWNVKTIYNFEGTLIAGAGGNPYVFFNPTSSDMWNETQFDVFKSEPNTALIFIFQNDILSAIANFGLYSSPDSGKAWQKFDLSIGYLMNGDFEIYNSEIFAMLSRPAATHYYSSKDNGMSWDFLDVQPLHAYDMQIVDNKIFAARLDGLYFRDINTTSVDEDILNISFNLEQNYPNPFNPNTKIKFTIPTYHPLLNKEGGMVRSTLKVYDILGNEIALLLNEEKPPGLYEVEFNADGLSSGVYFYKLQTGNYTLTKKMILLR